MAGTLSPVIESQISGESPTPQTHPLEGISNITGSALGTAGDLFNTWAKNRDDGSGEGGGDAQWRQKKAAREALSYELEVANSLERQGRKAEAKVVRSRAATGYVSSWGADDGFNSIMRTFTGYEGQAAIKGPEQAALEDLMADPTFSKEAMPAARAELLAEGIKNPTEEQLVTRAVKKQRRRQAQNMELELLKDGNEMEFLQGGEQAAINMLNDELKILTGLMSGRSANGAPVGAEDVVQAQNRMLATHARVRASLPPGVDTSNIDKLMANQVKLMDSITNTPERFADTRMSEVAASIIQNSDDPKAVMVASSYLKDPSNTIAMFPDLFRKYFEDAYGVLTDNTPFDYSLGAAGSGGVVPGEDGTVTQNPNPVTGSSDDDPFPEELATEVERLDGNKALNAYVGSVELLNRLNTQDFQSNSETRDSAASLITRTATLLGKARKGLSPNAIRKTLGPTFFNVLEKFREVDPNTYNILSSQVSKGLANVRKRWETRATGISQESGFAIDPKTKQVMVSMDRLTKRLGSQITPFMGMVRKYYNGDVDAFFRDEGRKARGDDNFASISGIFGGVLGEYKEVNRYTNAVSWLDKNISRLGYEDVGGDISNFSNMESPDYPVVSSEAMLNKMIKDGDLGPGDYFMTDTGELGRIP